MSLVDFKEKYVEYVRRRGKRDWFEVWDMIKLFTEVYYLTDKVELMYFIRNSKWMMNRGRL